MERKTQTVYLVLTNIFGYTFLIGRAEIEPADTMLRLTCMQMQVSLRSAQRERK
jgi:hypothetical protein